MVHLRKHPANRISSLITIKDNARPFINCLAAYFDMVAKFISVVDRIFQQGKGNRK